jgi:hypothetical protein
MPTRAAVVQTPGDIETRIERLSERWNALRNAALGRGTQPLVSAAIADVVGERFEAWRNWYADNTFADNVIPANVWDAVSDWETRYTDTRALAGKELAQSSLPLPLDTVVRADPSDIAARASFGLGAALVAGGAAYLAWRGFKRRGGPRAAASRFFTKRRR